MMSCLITLSVDVGLQLCDSNLIGRLTSCTKIAKKGRFEPWDSRCKEDTSKYAPSS
jgi:hypothetical protein